MFNYPELRKEYGKDYDFQGHSDCEAVGLMYKHHKKDIVKCLNSLIA